jgi:magnesium-transporting ATPase (P-type)
MIGLNQKIWKKIGAFSGLVWGFILANMLFRRWQERRKRTVVSRSPQYFRSDGISPQIQGLTEDQAASLLPPADEKADDQIRQRSFLKTAIRQTLFTIFNFNIFAMMMVNLLLDNPTGLLLNLLLLVISIALRVFQIIFTKRHMDEIVKSLRPRASVIREGRLRSIDTAQIVPGDTLAISEGDEILVDGTLAGGEEITIEQKDASGTANRISITPGETMHAGSYCVKGRGIYISKEGGWLRHHSRDGYQFELLQSKRTPLQRSIETILYILLGIVAVFTLLLVTDAILSTTRLVNATYRNAFSIIFGIAPTSLLMMLILKNVVGVLRISRRGALVYDPQSIEALAQVRTLCISKETLIGGFLVTLEPIKSPDGEEPLAENIIRHLLGDMVHSTFSYSTTMQMLSDALPGEQRKVKELAPFWESLGWFGITFEDADRQGTYILGKQDVLDEQLRKEKWTVRERVEAAVTGARRGMVKILQSPSNQDPEQETLQEDQLITDPSSANGEQSEPTDAEQDGSKPALGHRVRATLLRWLTPMEELQENEDEKSRQSIDEPAILLAYLPNLVSLFDRDELPHLPKGLIPLASVQIEELIHSETQQAVKSLLDEGIQIKILSAEPAEEVAWIASGLGISDEINNLSDSIHNTTIFGDLTPAGKAEVVRSIREQDPYVLMIGSVVGDIPALQQAFLGVVPKSATQAALQLTDIVLLDESIAVLPRVLSVGQRMINGALTTFKLYLSHVLMQLFLILFLFFDFLKEFPYQPTQASVASVFTMTIPNIFLVVWSSAKRLTKESIRWELLRFIIPVALSLTILVSSISILFNGRNSGDPLYAHLEVAYVLLLAGWVRVFFVQPPNSIWAGGTPLRGDMRVYRVVVSSALILIGFLVFPFFQESFRISLLASWGDFFIIVLAVLIWALTLKIIWWVISKLEK